jgi:hypothetical protein
MSNSPGVFESIDQFLKKSSPWSYLVLGLIGFGIVLAFILQSDSPVVDGTPKPGTTSTAVPTPTPTPVDDIYRPLNGQSLTPREKEKGRSIYSIENNGDSDAIVKLIDIKSGLTYRHSYVRSKRLLEIRDIAPGSYLVKFAVGEKFSKSKNTFTENAIYFLSSETVVFEEIIEGNTVKSTRGMATLFPSKGNVTVMKISEEEFADKPEPGEEKK